ncbi:MAG: methyltransferase [Bacteroidales bacterium]|nr:methyltransferase [Bacteroidales bacterium]
MKDYFQFRQFGVTQGRAAMKVGTDGVLLGSWEAIHGTPSHILDIGTGTGLLALMMAQRFPAAHVTAIDIDEGALADAADNISASPFSRRITLAGESLQTFVAHPSACCQYDVIVCNPPYYDNSLQPPDTSRTTARHTGTLPFRDLARAAFRLLSPSGDLCVILPTESLRLFTAETAMAGLTLSAHYAVKTVPRKAPRRHLLRFSKSHDVGMVQQTVTLMDADGSRSAWYSHAMRDFYLPAAP